jgi:hemerythrin
VKNEHRKCCGEGICMDKFKHITWDPKFTVHIEEIDAQHRNLFDIANQLIDIYESNSNECHKIIEKLVEYISIHFHTEQKIMMKSNYPAFNQHVREHDKFIDKVGEFLQSYRKMEENLSANVITFLSEWIYSHTTSLDLKYAEHLLKSGYLK